MTEKKERKPMSDIRKCERICQLYAELPEEERAYVTAKLAAIDQS